MSTNQVPLRDKMLAVMADVNAQVAEREELVELIAIALLTRKNLFLLGAPGQAKSYAINAFRSRITGARQFERLLSKQTDEEQLFGRIDLSSLIPGSVPESVLKGDSVYENLRFTLRCAIDGQQEDSPVTFDLIRKATEKLDIYRSALAALHTGEPTVQTAGKIPEADIVFLDECFKANDGVLNSLLTALNERKYTNEGRTYSIPTISFFAASNEIPNFADPQEKILEALYDRLELKVVTENISDRTKRLSVLRDKQNGHTGQIAASITLDELESMQQEVAAIPVPDSVNELADDILCELRKSGIPVSDRKYLNYYPIAQAKAWLSGHATVESKDLLTLKNYLWQKPGDRPAVETTLNRMCVNPMQDKVNGIRAMAVEAQEEFDAARQDASKPKAGSRALIKLRGEFIRLYGMQQDLANAAQSDSERALTDGLLTDLEQINKQAHEAVNFTHVPLEQMAAMQ
ncbi:AAA family ATPase [uncultured Oscillibacter sp.]|uniref:AAA family ATPase n=1 Tax=uncultured Oscillibacter sp. TaxID=876091 RepID=UPI00262D56B1|nr:AAA family ATPase [uncultured Oscillibacter sp.]